MENVTTKNNLVGDAWVVHHAGDDYETLTVCRSEGAALATSDELALENIDDLPEEWQGELEVAAKAGPPGAAAAVYSLRYVDGYIEVHPALEGDDRSVSTPSYYVVQPCEGGIPEAPVVFSDRDDSVRYFQQVADEMKNLESDYDQVEVDAEATFWMCATEDGGPELRWWRGDVRTKPVR